MKPDRSPKEIEKLAWEGIEQFSGEVALYVRPMFFAGSGFIQPNPDDTKFALVLEEMPLPGADGFSVCVSSFRRPSPEMAPTEAKASCLYPNIARALAEANKQGFDNAIMLDPIGNVAEFASANLFMVKDGVAHTPMPNGTFLNGVTRQRVMQLLRDAGTDVVERRIRLDEVLDADEVFSTGNYGKVQPATRINNRDLQPGPVFRKARELYFDWARSLPSPLQV
jgi:branched-chain amino acid aminotransferase